MARKRVRGHRRRRGRPLGTIWHCPDELWVAVARVLDELDPPAATGRKRIDQRKALDGMIYQMRTGCQWNALPRELGDDASVHRTMQRWVAKDVFPLIWSLLVAQCADLGGVDFDWQPADGAMRKARSGGIK
ncbi:MAG: transposase, partial [Phycisphaerales bacterium]|nr:transposase [Phycisphaerales bacterium]